MDDQPKKYRAYYETDERNQESGVLNTDNPLEVIKMFIEFDDMETGRHISLPNFWDRMIIEKKKKEKELEEEE